MVSTISFPFVCENSDIVGNNFIHQINISTYTTDSTDETTQLTEDTVSAIHTSSSGFMHHLTIMYVYFYFAQRYFHRLATSIFAINTN